MNDDTQADKVQLPIYPDVLFPWSESDKEQLQFKGDTNDLVERMKFKLYSVWLLWCDLRNSVKLIEIVNKTDPKEDPDFFYVKNVIVNTIDRCGKILCNTDLIKELVKTDETNV